MGSYFYRNNKEDFIGKGAFGKVYKKNEIITVAEKRIEKDEITKVLQKSWETVKEIIKSEINNMNKCQSINVVKIYDYSFNNDYIVIQMELCDKTLEQYRIEKGGTLSTVEIKEIFIQLNNALKYLNQNNIIHRDLKLQNVLIKIKDNKNIIKLGDFGLSKYNHENEVNKTICGTPAYMAPEVMNGNYVSKADIWSVGVMIYILRYGENPSFKDVYKLDYNKIYNEEDELLLNLLNRIFEEPNKRITWNEYFSHEFFKEGKNSQIAINLNQKKNIKIIADIEEEITCMLMLYNNDLCFSSKDQILIYNTNNFVLKYKFIVNKNFIINHLLLLEENLIGASLDDGNFYIIKLYNDNCFLTKYKTLEAKNKITITIKLIDEPKNLVSGCESGLIFWKKNQDNEYEKDIIIKYKGKVTSLIEYPKKYLIGALNFNESIKIFSLNTYKEIKTFDNIICTGYQLFSSYLDENTLIIVGGSFYIFDLEKLELIKTIEYDDYYINSIVKFGNSYLIGIAINREEEDFFQLHQVIYDEKSQEFIQIAYQDIHKGNIISILLYNDTIITGSCDKTIKFFK